MGKLRELLNAGVNVRVMAWVLPFISNEKVEQNTGIGSINFHTLLSVLALRTLLPPENVLLNMLAHTFGTAHYKTVICGDRTRMRAYTSGLDPAPGRLNKPGLRPAEVAGAFQFQLVAGSQAEFDAIRVRLNNKELEKDLYDQFQNIWNLDPDLPNPPDWDDVFSNPVVRDQIDLSIQTSSERSEWIMTLYVFDVGNGEWYHDTYNVKRSGITLDVYQWTGGGWHDIGVRVEGNAAGAMHDFFRDMWNEQLQRPVERFRLNNDTIVSHDPSWRQLNAREALDLPANSGRQYVQVLRTIPQMNFNASAKERGRFLVPDDFKLKFGVKGNRIKIGPGALRLPAGVYAASQKSYRRAPIGFARNGVFEFKVALKKAIEGAERYIFIADQGLYAMEVMDWIGSALIRKPQLRVILVYGADPADPPSNFLAEALNNHLIYQIPPRWERALNNISFREWFGNVVHCKVTIVDDTWCAIGSANCMRRSLYTDIELSTGILEPPTADASLPVTPAEEDDPVGNGKLPPSFVQSFRRDLWAHYCGISLEPANRNAAQAVNFNKLLKLDSALALWNKKWGTRTAGLRLRKEFSSRVSLPYRTAPNDPFSQNSYDREDADSRRSF
jgi:phosphatidylserine/phosphatidylglycerophosphate/cardiolipin synthase-like enzyme